jgi:hypothetical protein
MRWTNSLKEYNLPKLTQEEVENRIDIYPIKENEFAMK